MPYAIELFLDDEAERRVREIWAALDAAGIQSLGGIPGTDYHPHVSFSVYADGDPEAVADALAPVLGSVAGLPLPLAPLGFFLTDEAVAFLGVVPSERLLGLHRAADRVLEPLVRGIGDYYRADVLLPHCTLAVGVADRERVARVVEGFGLPIAARAERAYVVEIPGGQNRVGVAALQ
ncbi:2'-5' RNA ligase family protein [Symbioplanes lichenis]|uniref:2'-5' RNA ligase family protein n=1 Tax=Symbioplanes lichenis TaxID=1629072 RepID=UPI002739F034|nr:2'-5' RNA ligase family protein [Actinoplanes lichenis]